MKKIVLSLIVCSNIVFANEINMCGVFTNVLQTRQDPSKIEMLSGATAHIYDTPNCNLNTGSIVQDDNSNQRLICDTSGEDAEATGNYGKNLNESAIFTWDFEDSQASNSVGGGSSHTIKKSNEVLSKNKYKTVKQNWPYYSFTWSPNANDIGVYKFDNILNTVTVDNIENKDVKIGQFITGSWNNTELNFNKTPNKIEIGKLSVTGSNGFDAKWEAESSIDITEMDIKSSAENDITLNAPTIRIAKENDNKMDLGNSNNDHIVIYADKLYIGEIDFGQYSTLEIHPHTPGQKVEVYIRQITFSSHSQIIMDSGNYHIKDVDIAGSGDGVSLMKASDKNQVINLIIDPTNKNHDFEIKSNYGINSHSTGGEFGNNPASNFRIFVNGDFTTGNGNSNSGTTINAIVYSTGEVDLGSSTYVRGAISSYKDITIGDDSKFYWDNSMDNLGNSCLKYQNTYACGIFPSVLTSYDSIISNANNDQVCGSASISYPEGQLTGDIICNPTGCGGGGSCQRVDPPLNKYNYNFPTNSKSGTSNGSNLTTLTKLEYGDLSYDKTTINFEPSNTYSDNDTKVMLLGNVNVSKSTLKFEPGDYFFDSLTIDNNNNNVVLPDGGPVRIFVKNDFSVSMNNLNFNSDTDDSSQNNLFVYVGGDFNSIGNGGGTTSWKAFMYVKGKVTLNNNSNKWKIYGGITAEGPITINGNNPHFIQEGNADDLGYGECPLCHETPTVSGMSFDFGQCPGVSIGMDSKIKIPIKSDKSLKNVSIDEAHKKSIFSFSIFSKNEVVDQDENKVRDAEQSNTGLVNVSRLGIDASLYDDKIVTYHLGDSNYNYGPTSSDSYQQTYTYTKFGFDFCKWYESSLYVAHYEDNEGRHYDSIVGQCKNSNSDNSELPHIGSFDAWDNDSNHNINDRNITTKIVNKEFTLRIASIKDGEMKKQPKEGSYPKKDITIKYALVDNNNNNVNITSYEDFDASSSAKITPSFTISKAYKNVYVQFKICSDFNDIKNKYNVYAYESCSNECTPSDSKEEKCIRKFYSSDNFAIRPDHFAVNVDTSKKYKAGNTISDISIKAVDASGNNVFNYNELSDDLNLKVVDDKITASNVDYSFTFNNGNADIDYIKYPEVGYIELNLSEKVGSEFAKVDEDDTPNTTQRLITSGSSEPFKVIPDHFAITDVNVSNFNQGKYTYLSEDVESMSGDFNATITAENKAGNPTKNYKAGLYAKDVNITIPFSPDKIENLTKIITQYGENNISDKNISFVIGEGNFSEAEFKLGLKINFNRDSGKPVNEFNLTLNDLNVTDEDDINGSENIDKNITFRYGKVTPENVSTYSSTSVVVPAHYYYYHNDWIINEEHKAYEGNVSSIYTKNSATGNPTVLTGVSITNGTQNIDLNITNVKSRPYKETLHLGIAPWLWYSKSGRSYKAPSSSNTDCSTHPCSNIIINKISKDWSGVGVDNSHNDVNKNTVDVNRSNSNNLNKQIYHKLNW
jgi:hypothetical protein